jgi:signal transduction histidine kinase
MTRRILASILAATAVALIVLGVPLAIAIGRLYRNQAVTQLQREVTLAAGAVPDTGLTGPDPVEAPPGADSTTVFGYYNQGGHLVAGVGPPLADATAVVALRHGIGEAIDHGHLVVSAQVTVGQQTTGAVRASTPLGALHHRLYRTWTAIAALGVGALGIAAIIGRSQARRLATPVTNLSAAMDRLGQGDFSVRVGASTGIPEVDRAASALDLTAQSLGRLLQREREFSANVSHQLRTPLAALRITLESALVSNHQSAHDALTDAIAELDRLEATVQELLAHARDTSRTRELVDFNAILSGAESRWRSPLAAAGRRFHVEVDDVPATRASGTAIAQIVDVLIDNAVNHGQGAVTVRVRGAGPGVAIDVADEGHGVQQDQRVFDRDSERADGHGIGLALARSLAQAEGGQLVLRRARPHPIFSLMLPDERQPDLVTGTRSVELDERAGQP